MKKILAASLLALAGSAHAAEGYVGAGLGLSSVSDFTAQDFMAAANDGSLTSATADDTDTAFRLFGGFQVNANLAIEAAYTDLGQYKASAVSDGSGFAYWAGPVEYKAEATALSVAARLVAPLNDRFSVHGKIGLARWDFNDTFSNGGFMVESSDSGTDPMFGIGAAVKTDGPLSVQAEYERFSDVADADIDVISLGLLYRLQ